MAKQDYRYYIAYGSNLNVRQMRARCPWARIAGTSVIEDYELLFKGSRTGSYLTIEPKAGARVPVAVWEVTARDEWALDRYEGFPNFYYKTEMLLPVRVAQTRRVRRLRAFVYIMHEDRCLGIPSDEYMAACWEGYQDFGFDKALLTEAVQRTMEGLR